MQHDAHVQSRIAHLDDTIRKVDELLLLRDKQVKLMHELRATLEHAKDGAYPCPECKGTGKRYPMAREGSTPAKVKCDYCDGIGRYRPESVTR